MKALGGADLRELVHRFDARVADRHAVAAEVTLGARQIYILPTRYGLLFSLVLVVLLLAAINYENALVYLLTFALAALAVVSFLHTQRNLLGLKVTATGSDPVFAGDPAAFRICVHNPSVTRIGLRVDARSSSSSLFDVPAADTHCVALPLVANKRGWLDCPPVELETRFPLGIAYAWSRRLRFTARCLVYPQPADTDAFASVSGSGCDGTTAAGREGEDFAGLRPYRPGDALARISWKTLAGGRGLHTKEFASSSAESVWIDWDDFAPAETEARLSLMTRALLDADESGLRFGLRLPGCLIEAASGAGHRARCLEALALHEDRA